MQIINKMTQCPQCGCIAFPDAIYCPKCGGNYRASKEMFKSIASLSMQEQENADNTVMKAYYQLRCPHHGYIDIKAAVIVPVMKCPLCQEN